MSVLLRLPRVIERTGLSRTVIYDRIKAGTFPPPVKLSERASAWPEHEIEACNAAQIRGRSKDEIRALVARLTGERVA